MSDVNQQNADPMQQRREELQNKVVAIITRKLEAGEMTEDRAKAIARQTLDKLPENVTLEQFYEAAKSLDKEFNELSTAMVPIIVEYQEKVKKQVDSHIQGLLDKNDYKAALEQARKAIAFESSLQPDTKPPGEAVTPAEQTNAPKAPENTENPSQ